MGSTATEKLPAISEQEKVDWWRYEQFENLLPGVSQECLQELTKSGLSPRDVESFKQKHPNCPLELIPKILI